MRSTMWIIVCIFFMLNGCTLILQKGRRSDLEKIESLRSRLEELNDARNSLKESLSKEIEDKQVRLEMAEKGLVITFVAEVLFDSGKAQLKPGCYSSLNKVVEVLVNEAYDNDIGVEGHTDNEPIKYSRWTTNWELSAQRALSVLYYLESKGISSSRLKAIGYGEYQPIESNDTEEGRQYNRRVEIVILPQIIREEEIIYEDDGQETKAIDWWSTDEEDLIEEELK